MKKIHIFAHVMTILSLSFLLTLFFGLVNAQVTTTTTPGGGTTTSFLGPKVIVFIVCVVVSIVTDGIAMGFLAGGFHPLRAITSSIPWSFVNVFWWDFIAPAVAGISFLNLKFFSVGNPAWGYWVGSNVIIAFIGNMVMEQVIFRFARGAAASPMSMDLALAGLDAVLPMILFMVLPMFGVI
jgi:hypothetical protein